MRSSILLNQGALISEYQVRCKLSYCATQFAENVPCNRKDLCRSQSVRVIYRCSLCGYADRRWTINHFNLSTIINATKLWTAQSDCPIITSSSRTSVERKSQSNMKSKAFSGMLLRKGLVNESTSTAFQHTIRNTVGGRDRQGVVSLAIDSTRAIIPLHRSMAAKESAFQLLPTQKQDQTGHLGSGKIFNVPHVVLHRQV